MSILPSAGKGLDGPVGGQISEVVGLILEKGLVIDVFVRVSLVGIEILTVDARVVVASVDTYLRFAEKAGRLNIEEATKKPGLPDVLAGVTGGQGLPGLIQGATGALGISPGDAQQPQMQPAALEQEEAPVTLADGRKQEEQR
jgi:hypothetical protein